MISVSNILVFKSSDIFQHLHILLIISVAC